MFITPMFLCLFWQDTCGARSGCGVLMDEGRRIGAGRRKKREVCRFTSAQRGTRVAVRETEDQEGSTTTTEHTKGTSTMEHGYTRLT